MNHIPPMPISGELQHASISREEFKRLFLKSDIFEAVTERLVDQAYKDLKAVPVTNNENLELVEATIGVMGLDPKTLQFFPIRMLLDIADVSAK